MAIGMEALKLDRSKWPLIALLCRECGYVDSFEDRMRIARRKLRKTPAGYIWSQCSNCRAREFVYDPGVRLLLESR